MLIPKGILISIGGNEDKGNGIELVPPAKRSLHFSELSILKRVLAELKSPESRIEVITTASSIPEELGETYMTSFEKLGATNVGLMHIKDRDDARKREYLERLLLADGVLFTGGNQLRLTMIFGGTDFHNILQQRYINEPFVIAGTSAGAMAMSNTMIYHGDSAGSLIKGEVRITTGLAFIKDIIIDTHFVNRGRFSRLAEAVAGNPSCIGVGISEDTGLLIRDGNRLETIGSGLVIVMDGFNIKHSNIADVHDGTPLSIENMIMHVLAQGNSYHIDERKFYSRSIENTAASVKKQSA